MPSGVAAFDTDQETALFLQGKATAMTEYTGTAHGVDDPADSKVVGQDRLRRHPDAGEERARHRHVHLRHRVGRAEPGRRCQVPRVVHVEQGAAGVRRHGGSAAVTGSALRDAALGKKYRWLPAIADAVDNSVPEAEDAGRAEDGGPAGHRAQPGAGGGDLEEVRLPADRPVASDRLRPTRSTPTPSSRARTSRPVAERQAATTKVRARRARFLASPYLLLLPAAIALAAVSLYPLYYGVRASFTGTCTAATSARTGLRQLPHRLERPVLPQRDVDDGQVRVLSRSPSRRCWGWRWRCWCRAS